MESQGRLLMSNTHWDEIRAKQIRGAGLVRPEATAAPPNAMLGFLETFERSAKWEQQVRVVGPPPGSTPLLRNPTSVQRKRGFSRMRTGQTLCRERAVVPVGLGQSSARPRLRVGVGEKNNPKKSPKKICHYEKVKRSRSLPMLLLLHVDFWRP